MTPNFYSSVQTRPSLLSRLKNWQDLESWQEFYNLYSSLIRGMALSAGLSHSEAQDALQETVITVAKKLKGDEAQKPAFKYDPAVGSFRGWLLHITRWRIEDQFRKRGPLVSLAARRDSQSDRTPTETSVPDPNVADFEAQSDREFKRSLYETALGRVKRSATAKYYQVYDLYVTKQWPAGKVARILGITRAQVFLAKHRVLALIKKEIRSLEKEISAWAATRKPCLGM
jgi:RNA polymerase sigma-70 factor (ECF subfamily)